jgi:hypothetical protein
MATVDYLRGTEEITPEPMNALFRAFSGKMDAIFGGRSFVLGWKLLSTGAAQLPASLFGKPFFFVHGHLVYAPLVPGFTQRVVPIFNPLTNGPEDTPSGSSYSHAEFTAAAAAITPISFDTANRIVTVQDIPQSAYPAGITRIAGVSLFEHSLEEHTVTLQGPDDTEPHRYWIKEQSAPIPTKHCDYALAEIIIEGVNRVEIPWRKFDHFRAHNLQAQPCTLVLGGSTFVLQAFECQSYRLNEAGTAFAKSPFRYFQEYRDDDPRMFWFWPSIPASTVVPAMNDTVVTSSGGMQGNNLTNPAVLYDFIAAFRNPANYAQFHVDPHELCDMRPLVANYATSFGDPGNDATKLLDLFCHKGTLKIARVSRTVDDPRAPGIKLTTFEDVEFRGWATMVSDFAAKQITVRTNGAGNVELISTDPANEVYIAPISTNLLRDPDYGGPERWFRLRSLVYLGGAYELNPKILEHYGQTHQDAIGEQPFHLGTRSDYRIFQRTLTESANTRTYRNPSGAFITVTGEPTRALRDANLSTARTFSGLHVTTVGDLRSLSFFGHPTRSSQNDAHVTFSAPVLRFTPEGLVMTFTESVRADVLPAVVEAFGPQTWYYNSIGTKFSYDPTSDRWLRKHTIRFRKQGWGYGQHGKAYAGFLPPWDGRLNVVDWIHEVSGPQGTDFQLPFESTTESTIRILRQLAPEDLGTRKVGGIFFSVGGHANLDALLEFEARYNEFPWFQTNITSLGANSESPRTMGTLRLLSMPLAAEHYNGFAQAVNQLKTGRPLDYRCLRYPFGSRVISLDPAPVDLFSSTRTIAFPNWQNAFPGVPAPVDALFSVSGPEVDYLLAWCQSVGLPVRHGTAGLPENYRDFVNRRGRTARLKRTLSGRVSGASFSGNRVAPGLLGGNTWWSIFSATVEGSIAPPVWEEGPEHGAGIAYLALPEYVVEIGVETAGNNTHAYPQLRGTVNILTAYNSSRWVSGEDFLALIESSGFPFIHTECIIPLRLDYVSLIRSAFEAGHGSQLSHSWQGEFASRDTGQPSNQPAPGLRSQEQQFINGINSNNPTHERVITTDYIDTDYLVFRLAEDSGEALWKLPNNDKPPEIYHRGGNRTTGAFQLRLGSHLRWQTRDSSLAVSDCFDVPGRGTYRTVSPWYPVNRVDNVSILGSLQYTRQETAGPRGFWDYPDTRNSESYLACVYGERRWCGFYVLASEGLQASQPLYLIAQSDWGKAENWWRDTDDWWFSSAFLISTAPPRAIPRTANNLVRATAGAGVTVLKPEPDQAFKVLFDPLELSVTL